MAPFISVLPEIILATMALVLLMVGVFVSAGNAPRYVANLSIVSLLVAGYFAWTLPQGVSFALAGAGPMHVLDDFAAFAKIVIAGLACLTILLAGHFLQTTKVHKFEYYILLLLSVLGMYVMVSADDLIVMYIGLELMSFSLYILAAFDRDNTKSAEAGLKYFIIGSLASGLVLYGMSLLYGLSGSTQFDVVAMALHNLAAEGMAQNVTLSLALVLLMTGLAFKISAAPFHMWAPDVYEGAPTPVTAFMAVVPKLAAVVLLIRVLHDPLAPLMVSWQPILMVLAVCTMVVGSFLAIVQTNVKRLLAYSSIGHVGFMLVGLAAGTEAGVAAVVAYGVIYGVMTAGAFAVMLSLQKRGVYFEEIKDLAGLSKHSPLLAFVMLVFMFSLAGVPPLAGFWAKFMVFKAAVDAGLVWLAIAGVLASVVAAYYALKIVKTMYFDQGDKAPDGHMPTALMIVVVLTTLATIGLGIFPDIVAQPAAVAVASLF